MEDFKSLDLKFNQKSVHTINLLEIIQKRLKTLNSSPTSCSLAANSLTNSGTGQFLTEEINSLHNYQKEQRKKDASIADLEEIRYQKIMALCDEITHGNFDGKIDSGTSSMQTTPHHHNNGNYTLPRNRRNNTHNNSNQNLNQINQNFNTMHQYHSQDNHSLQIELHQLKNKIQHIESQLDEAQRNAEIEKSLIQAELKNENQVLAEDEKKLREINHELECLKQDFQEKLDNIDNTQEEFLILEQTSIIEDEHETKEKQTKHIKAILEKEIESRKVSSKNNIEKVVWIYVYLRYCFVICVL